LHGPTDLSFGDVARTLSQVLGRKIVYIKCDRDEARNDMLASGMSENAASLMLEMYEGVETGRMSTLQPRSEETTTPTTLEEFTRERILPMIAEPVTH
jgi:hypothetical protein